MRAGALLGGSVGVSSLKASDWRSAGRKRKSSNHKREELDCLCRCLARFLIHNTLYHRHKMGGGCRGVGGGAQRAELTPGWLELWSLTPKEASVPVVTSQRADFCSEFCPFGAIFPRTEATEEGKRGICFTDMQCLAPGKVSSGCQLGRTREMFCCIATTTQSDLQTCCWNVPTAQPRVVAVHHRRCLKVEDTLICSFHFTSLSVTRFLNGY